MSVGQAGYNCNPKSKDIKAETETEIAICSFHPRLLLTAKLTAVCLLLFSALAGNRKADQKYFLFTLYTNSPIAFSSRLVKTAKEFYDLEI